MNNVKRVLLKLSGEALAGDKKQGLMRKLLSVLQSDKSINRTGL